MPFEPGDFEIFVNVSAQAARMPISTLLWRSQRGYAGAIPLTRSLFGAFLQASPSGPPSD
jgi:hypothetical protein